MKKPISYLPVINLLAIIGICVYLLYPKQHDGYMYVDTYKVYEGFVMKKQLQKQLEESMRNDGAKLDSLRLQIKINSLQFKTKKSNEEKQAQEFIERELHYREQEIKQKNGELADQFDKRIWAQINQYLMDYGKDHDARIIFGANGNGSVMYGDEAKDVTQDVITFINKRHADL